MTERVCLFPTDDNFYEALAHLFDEGVLRRGTGYFEKGHVQDYHLSKDGVQIRGTVRGSSTRKSYQVAIRLDPTQGKNYSDWLKSANCSCPVGSRCKHVVATLMAIEEQVTSEQEVEALLPQAGLSDDESQVACQNWLETLSEQMQGSAENSKSRAAVKEQQAIVYQLALESITTAGEVGVETCTLNELSVLVCVSRLLKRGGYGKPKGHDINSQAILKIRSDADEPILAQLLLMASTSRHFYSTGVILNDKQSSEVLCKIIATGRCCMTADLGKGTETEFLHLGEEKALMLNWQLQSNGDQILSPNIKGMDAFQLTLVGGDVWYVDFESATVGRCRTPLPSAALRTLMRAPALAPEMASQVAATLRKTLGQRLDELPKEQASLLPAVLELVVDKKSEDPKPVVVFDIERVKSETAETMSYRYFSEYFYDEEVTARLGFYYGEHAVPFRRDFQQQSNFKVVKGKKLWVKPRQKDKEEALLKQFSAHFSMRYLSDSDKQSNLPAVFVLQNIYGDETALERLRQEVAPELQKSGWEVVLEHPRLQQALSEDEVEWFSQLDYREHERSRYDYFQFKLGVLINGEEVNLLPLIARLLRSYPVNELASIPDEQLFPLTLPTGQLLNLSFARIRPLLSSLLELHNQELTDDGALNLEKHHAHLMAELELAYQAAQMRWFGGEKIRELGQRLTNFTEVAYCAPASDFKADLRPYQQDGLNWLQFLREFGLGGILADDMGLGKTVQTLAHLCVEEQEGRLKKPVLIVAPTSLMFNWAQESERFAPHLRVLVFHGGDRHQFKGRLSDYDLVFTTYPLLVRDKALLSEQKFYYVILDEAQAIKNHKAKSTQVVHQLKAEHRLCLTGTPLENHLGELWSLCHFLMPGLLGSYKEFRQHYRTPIEKHSDTDKRMALARRIKPFILRRHKESVLHELPEKTLIAQTVELEGPQRDLYESIRLSMEKKVRDAITQQGLGRSHLVILDALLKLRQICCDPRLLKLSSAQQAHGHSCKLNLLMEMLPNLVEDGRKILLFSQFTSMLALIEEALNNAGLPYVKLTGSTRNRAEPICAFQDGKVPIFLISLKAGGTGLNLTAADTVIHYDPWWNPAVEDQATDRAHRIGQDKPVFVYKLVAAGTVEETIQVMQENKRALMDGLFTENAGRQFSLTPSDLDALFSGG